MHLHLVLAVGIGQADDLMTSWDFTLNSLAVFRLSIAYELSNHSTISFLECQACDIICRYCFCIPSSFSNLSVESDVNRFDRFAWIEIDRSEVVRYELLLLGISLSR